MGTTNQTTFEKENVKQMARLTFEQRQRANELMESSPELTDGMAFEIIALRDFAQYVRDFYQRHFDVMPVAFQTVDNEAATLLGE